MTDVRGKTLGYSRKRRVAMYPVWGVGDVWIQSLTERERQFIEAKWVRAGKIDEIARQEHLAWWIRSTVVTDEQASEFVFTDADVPSLAEMDSKVADSYREAINQHCAWRGVEDAKKNSEESQLG